MDPVSATSVDVAAARKEQLFYKYVYPLRGMIFKLCSKYSLSSYDVQENYQDALVNLYRYIDTYDPQRPLHAWVHTCVKRQVWASDRKRSRHDNKDFDQDIQDYEDSIIDDEHVSSNVLDTSNWKELYGPDIVEVLEELPQCYQDVIILQQAGYSLKEIAEIEYNKGTIRSPKTDTIKTRLRFARHHLQNNLTRDGKRLPR